MMGSIWKTLAMMFEGDEDVPFGDRWRARLAKKKQKEPDKPKRPRGRSHKNPLPPEDDSAEDRFGAYSPRSQLDIVKPRAGGKGVERPKYADPDRKQKRHPTVDEVEVARVWAQSLGRRFTLPEWNANFPDDVSGTTALSKLVWRPGLDPIQFPVRRIPGQSLPTAGSINRNVLKSDDTFEWHDELPMMHIGPTGGAGLDTGNTRGGRVQGHKTRQRKG